MSQLALPLRLADHAVFGSFLSGDNEALVAMGQEFFARIERDDDEGELSYSFSKDVPDQPHDEMDAHFKAIFNSQSIEVRRRANKTDSSEVRFFSFSEGSNWAEEPSE